MCKFEFSPFLLISAYETVQIRISGKAIDIKKNSLAGVSINIKYSHDGATTDSSGNYSLIAKENRAQILTATSTRCKPFEEKINTDVTPILFSMELKQSITELKVYSLIKKRSPGKN